MAEPTIDDVARFIKYQARAGQLGTDEGSVREAAQARDLVLRMKTEFPTILETARRVKAAMGPPQAEPLPDPVAEAPSRWGAVAAVVSDAIAGRVVESVAQAARVASRQDEIAPGRIRWSPQDCAPEQVCILLRANRADLRRRATREDIADGVIEILLNLASGRT